MARIRTIKPEFWTDEKIVTLPTLTRLLFIGLWNFADDEGYFWNEPLRIKLQILPADDCDISSMLDQIVSNGLVTAYESTTGKTAFLITHFAEHQRVNKPSPSKIAASVTTQIPGVLREHSGSPPGVVTESSGLKGREGKGNGKGMEGKGRVVSPTAQEPPEADSPPTPDQAEEVLKAWNSTEGILKADKLTPKRRAAIHARFRESYFRSNWTTGISLVGSSAFCQGDNDRGWKASLDWFLKPETLVKIIEGKYANASRAGPAGGVDLFGGLREFVKNGG